MATTPELTEDFLDCRDLRHAWQRSGDGDVKKSGKAVHFTRILVCSRCQAERSDKYRVTKTTVLRLGSSYHYPKGYVVKGGFSVEEARVALFSRWVKWK